MHAAAAGSSAPPGGFVVPEVPPAIPDPVPQLAAALSALAASGGVLRVEIRLDRRGLHPGQGVLFEDGVAGDG